jgi:hypothetical protein
VEYILLTPLLTIIGGGSTVLVANEYSILSDIVPETERSVYWAEYPIIVSLLTHA